MNNCQCSPKASYSVPLSAIFSTLPILWKNSLRTRLPAWSRLGRMPTPSGVLLESMTAGRLADDLVDVANHVNRGAPRLVQRDGKKHGASIGLLAGRHAKRP